MKQKNNIIGNTPMIQLNYEYQGEKRKIYIKLEYYNLTGSIKDRVAYYIISKAKEQGTLKPSMPIIEATSGNTGISLAALGAYYKHPVYIYMPDWASIERVKLMKSYGANVKLISKEEGGFIKCVNQVKDVDIFVCGVGTGGTLMGTGKRLKQEFKDLKIVALEPDKMPIISTGIMISNHKIEGIGDDFVPDLVEKEAIDDIILVNDDDAINMSRRLSAELGLGVGISSGANIIASILWQNKTNKPVVTVFPDDNKKYLSTDLMKDIEPNKEFISNKIKLLDYIK